MGLLVHLHSSLPIYPICPSTHGGEIRIQPFRFNQSFINERGVLGVSLGVSCSVSVGRRAGFKLLMHFELAAVVYFCIIIMGMYARRTNERASWADYSMYGTKD